MTGLDDDIVIEGRRYWRLTEWRAVVDGSARASRDRHRATLEPQGVKTLERAVEIPALEPGTTRVVVALFRDGDEAISREGANGRLGRTLSHAPGRPAVATKEPSPAPPLAGVEIGRPGAS